MKKIALITHSFHKKTESAINETRELFPENQNFKIDIFYNKEWGAKEQFEYFDTNIEGYDAVVILQLISLNLLSKIKSKNIIFIPMYDYARNFDINNWLPAMGIKILSPVKALSKTLNNLGLDYFDIKYFPRVDVYTQPNFNNIFFWNRVESIDYKLVLNLLANYKFENLNIHESIDPGNKPIKPSKKEILEYNITFSKWFESKDNYENKLKDFGIYIAARPYEGGTASYMDALKSGKIVIAPNNPPYIDYIVNQKNGLLYNIDNPLAINFDNLSLQDISKNAFKSVQEGRKLWELSLPEIHEYIFNHVVNSNQIIFKMEIEKSFQNRWMRFGKLSKKNKFKVFFKYIKNKLSYTLNM